MKMAGREVFKAAVLAMADACDAALRQAGRHRRTRSTCSFPTRPTCGSSRPPPSTPGIPMDKVMVNVDRYGNTSSASIPLALDQAIAEGRRRTRVAPAARRVRRRLHLGKRGVRW